MGENLRCPSCSGEHAEDFIPLPDLYPEFMAVICRDCGMRGPKSVWNTRASVSPDDIARLMGLVTRRVHELEAELAALKAARTPGPATDRLLAAAKAVLDRLQCVDWATGEEEIELVAAVAEHEAAARKRAGAADGG